MIIPVATLGYCKAITWREGLKNVLSMKSPDTIWDHYFVYHYYPEDMENNKQKLKQIADDNGIKWVFPEKNLGLHEGMNWVMNNYLQNAEFLMYLDPDTSVDQFGWDLALMKVLEDPSVGWASLKCCITDEELKTRKHHREIIKGFECVILEEPYMLDCGIFRMDWVRDQGGFSEPAAFYGGIEASMFEKIQKTGLKIAVLEHYYTNQSLKRFESPVFREWKFAHSDGKFTGNFDEYLEVYK